MRGQRDIAAVGIRGGGWTHVRERLRFYRPRCFEKIRVVGLVVCGNDLDRRNRRDHPTALRRTEEDFAALIRFVTTLIPQARVISFDILPRRSPGSIFNSRARAIANNMKKEGEKHSHVNFIKSFTTINDKKHKWDARVERYPVADVFYRGGDGTHLNAAGYRALSKIVDWAVTEERAAGSAYCFEEQGWRVRASTKF